MASPEIQLKELLQQLTLKDFPAISVAVGKGHHRVWQASAGYCDLQHPIKITPDTGFGIGSITKVFVAVIILQLTEEGLLSLDLPLSRWLEKSFLSGIANAETATVRQLLSHYAGIPSWENQPAWICAARGKGMEPEKRWSPAETIEYIRGKEPLCRPGEQFNYSNTNFTLLGLLIERVTQNTFETELYRRIIGPLALENTCLTGAAFSAPLKIANQYHHADNSFIKNAGLSPWFKPANNNLVDVSASNLSVEWAVGGIISTAQDLISFILALKNGRLLNAQSRQEMQHWMPADSASMGLSLFRAETNYGRATGHGGNVLGFSACAWWYEKTDCAVVILTNLGSMHADPEANCASKLFRESEIGRLAQEICALN
ncbi:serine hydrolase domain-containing protein [Erwinia sp. MMLR14_017]|uniref:serine hydrolase domain-containing protein n=1 Tax=Erwinia sp. MMLR14_017 TaxID=3093842 RepID=UPI0029907635|nr:serine hydrolase domain-containing protein [Erwinia sp. MMLR14_017]MDW8844379.1 serine hydrolase domain-containing protein [Erwinia sp. MMLR14_017]